MGGENRSFLKQVVAAAVTSAVGAAVGAVTTALVNRLAPAPHAAVAPLTDGIEPRALAETGAAFPLALGILAGAALGGLIWLAIFLSRGRRRKAG